MEVAAKPGTGSAKPFGAMVSLARGGRGNSGGPRIERLGGGRFWLNVSSTKYVAPQALRGPAGLGISQSVEVVGWVLG